MGNVKRFEPPRDNGLLTVDQAAAHLGIAPGTLRHWISAKRIEYVKVGKLTRFRRAALDRWIERQIVPAVNE